MAGDIPDNPHSNGGRRLRRSPWRTSCRTQARNEKRILRWVDIERIAQALNKNYPTENPEPLSIAALTALIARLPNFTDAPYPPNGLYVDLIREAWLDIIHPSATENTDQSTTKPPTIITK
jgi:FeS assembly protein IscX